MHDQRGRGGVFEAGKGVGDLEEEEEEDDHAEEEEDAILSFFADYIFQLSNLIVLLLLNLKSKICMVLHAVY